jgi:ATP adenylyltransferase
MAKIIYAPLREKYVETNHKDEKCPFCNYAKHPDLLVHEGNTCVVVANKYPYLYGHLLVFPKRHITDITELNKDEDKDMMLLIKRAIKQLKLAFNADGFDVGYQTKFGGGSVEHVHFHVVPRYKGDTGFMNILENTNVMSEKPEFMVQKLKRKNHMV